MSIIKTVELKRSFEMGTQSVEALKGIDLNVQAGEFIAIMGPSGSGKTTLMNIIGCLDTPTSGQYLLNNQEVSTFLDDDLAMIRNKEIGFVFQSFHLLARSSALDNVMLPLKYAGEKKNIDIDRAKKALLDVGLGDRMDHSPSELSGGQQQRVAIARALVNSPSILFADEPTGNLDEKNSKKFIKLIQILNKKYNQTFIIVTHNKEFQKISNNSFELKNGKLNSI